MNYHNITTDDMKNGDGLRVVIWLSGCSLQCRNCFNPQTWDKDSGIPFTEDTMNELIEKLDKPYISGLTISGGHPLEAYNLDDVLDIVKTIKSRFHDKTIWLYTGYEYEYLFDMNNLKIFEILDYVDVLVDGKFIEPLKDVNCPYRGSTNQRLIDVQKSIKEGRTVLYEN